ncbi:MAG: DNA double-strand break repair nuclease NurA [archaeon]
MWIHRTEEIACNQSKISSLLSANNAFAESVLPEFLVSLSNTSMKTAQDANFRPREFSILDEDSEDLDTLEPQIFAQPVRPNLKPIRIESNNTKTPIAAIDVSSIKIGDTDRGLLCALRGVIVWRIDGSYVYLRCGPLTFHIGNDSQDIMNKQLGLSSTSPFELSSSLESRIMNRLRNTMERWMQREVCSSNSNSIILFDGSLTAGTPDNPVRYLREILQEARRNSDVVLALSKETRLEIGRERLISLLDEYSFPCLADIDSCVFSQFPSSPVKLMGHVSVVKLASGGFSFRLDIDREVSRERGLDAVSRLAGNDVIHQGYPETLRLAHILSAFTANEVIGVQRFVTRTHGLTICPKLNLRRQLFGPFGTSRDDYL